METRFTLNFLKGSAFTSAGAVISSAFHLVSIMLIARIMSAEQVGAYVLLLAAAHFLTVFGGLGLNLTLTRCASIGSESDTRETFLMPAIVMRIAALGVITVLVLALRGFLARFFEVDVGQYVFYLPVLFVLASFRDLFLHLLQGLRRFRQYAMVQIASAAAKCLLIVSSASLGGLTLNRLLQVEALVLSLSVAILAISVSTRVSWRARTGSAPYFGLLRFSIPLYLNNILTVCYDRIGIFLVAALLDPISIAYYGVADKLPEGFMRLFRSFITVYFPNMSKLLTDGRKEDAQKVMNKSIHLVSIAILALVLIVYLFSTDLMRVLFTERYVPAGFACSLLMLNVYLRSVANIMGYSLVSAGYSSIPVRTNTICCTINIIGNLVFIPRFGFIGAVYSLLIMNIVAQLIYCAYLRRIGIRIDTKVLNPVGVLALTVSGYILLGGEQVIAKLLCASFYVGLCVLLNADLRYLFTRVSSRCVAMSSNFFSTSYHE